MASIVLNAASAAMAASTCGLGAAIAGTALRTASQSLSTQLFARPRKRHIEGARLEDLAVQTSTYGRAIAQLFGTVRLAGNVIWSQPIRETANTTTVRSSGGKGAARVIGSAVAGFTELALFHPVDTVAKRLMS